MRRAAAAAFLFLLAGACKKKPAAPRVEGAAPSAAARQISTQPEPLPAWTQREPRVERRGSRRYAVAVGQAAAVNLALARAAAEERARALLAPMLSGKPPGGSFEGPVSGARIEQAYTAADGRVFVELSAPVLR
jgi:hypothetical protein